jgi:hypothetical protein
MEIAQIMESVREQLGSLWSEDTPEDDATLEEWAEWVLGEEVWFDEASAPKEPVARALKRMADAYGRGGFKKMVRSTEIRLNAIKNPSKREGMLAAIALHIKDDKYSSSEKKTLLGLLRKTTHAHAAATEGIEERGPGQSFMPPLELKVGPAEGMSAGVQVPKHYLKTCSQDSFRKNIEYFYRVKGQEWSGDKKAKMKRAIAASYSVLKTACGVKSKAKMKPSEIIAAGGKS